MADLLNRLQRAWAVLTEKDNLGEEDPPRIRALVEYRAAVHEAGHAVTAWRDPYMVELRCITIDQSSIGNGHVQYARTATPSSREGAYWYEIVTALGGMASEMEEFNRLRSGPSTLDLQRARQQALQISNIRSRPWETPPPQPEFDVGRMFRRIDPKTRQVLNECWQQARWIVEVEQPRINEIVRRLTHYGDMGPDEIRKVFGRRPFHF